LIEDLWVFFCRDPLAQVLHSLFFFGGHLAPPNRNRENQKSLAVVRWHVCRGKYRQYSEGQSVEGQ
jgi:hypothetical protein